jgi:8-hydroxy-5-deazaflavin:NADPH oxidoreductase
MPVGSRTTGFRDSNDRVPSPGCARQQLGKGVRLTTAIIGVGNIGGTLARQLVSGDETVIVAAKDKANAEAVANQLGPLARAASVEDAIAGADAVVFAVWLDTTRELIAKHASLLENKVVVDPSNPIGFDANGEVSRTLPDDQSAGSIVAGLLPANTHYVKAFGTLSVESLAEAANRDPRVALFYATDDDDAATTIERLIRASGFDPVKAGGAAAALRIEMPGGDLHQFGLNGELVDIDQARAAIAARKVTA